MQDHISPHLMEPRKSNAKQNTNLLKSNVYLTKILVLKILSVQFRVHRKKVSGVFWKENTFTNIYFLNQEQSLKYCFYAFPGTNGAVPIDSLSHSQSCLRKSLTVK